MSDRPLSPVPDGSSSDDLAVSAYLDGAATPDERARIEADPTLLARVERFRAQAASMAVTPPPGLADVHVAAALAGFGSGRRSVAWYRRIPLGAAAAAVVAVALVGALTQIDLGDSDADTASVVADASTEESASDDAAGGSAGPDQFSAGLDVATIDELVDRLDEAADRDGATPEVGAAPGSSDTSPPDPAGPACDPLVVAGIDPGAVAERVGASVDGRPVTVVRTRPGRADVERLVVVDDDSCAVVFDRTG